MENGTQILMTNMTNAIAKRNKGHNTGVQYVDFGNNQSTLNQKSRVPFSVYKERLDLEAHLHYKIHYLNTELNKAGKKKLKIIRK